MRRIWRDRDPEAVRARPMPAWASGRRHRPQRIRRPRPGTMLLLAAGLVGMIVYAASPEAPPPAGAGPLTGRVDRVVDGDTLDLAGHRIRLVGLDAPELQQTCTAADGGEWRCGEAARSALRTLAGDADLTCLPAGGDRYGRTLATCRAGTLDLAEALVGEGLAVASGRYGAAEAGARSAGRGLWAGRFVEPAEWRRGAGRDEADGVGNPSRFERFVRWLLGAMNG